MATDGEVPDGDWGGILCVIIVAVIANREQVAEAIVCVHWVQDDVPRHPKTGLQMTPLDVVLVNETRDRDEREYGMRQRLSYGGVSLAELESR